ncbi:hypothetical protein JCM3770_004897 [Rhodotorula araucariae]
MHGLLRIFEGQPCPLPLVRVAIRASLLDVSAGVSLEQEYRNNSGETAECTYRFPVPGRASVCAFSVRKEDGRRILATVQEKEEARVTYDQAISQGKLASLLEQGSSDTFVTAVGNILPGETVVVELTYVTELTEGETNDSIRFHIPANVGVRWGDPPRSTSEAAPAAATGNTFVTINVSIESAAPVSKINCPSHAVSTDLGPDPSLPNAAELPFAQFARVSCKSGLALSRDFVLEITSAALDRPRCVVEHHPTEDSAAVSLTVVPRFQLPELKSQEYVFLVDRSGSMGDWGGDHGGGRISLARQALVVLLRSLPHKDTTFNIVSFGSSHEAQWSKGSRAYNQSTLDEATRLVDSMEANLGGTEIRAALDYVFQLRDSKRPTSVFVLTDGDAWDLDGVLDTVTSAVSASSPAAPLRVFSLGIGNSASTAMCDSLARVGHGIAQYVSDGESFTGKTARLLKAAKTPPILKARLDFDVDVEKIRQSNEDDFELVEPLEQDADRASTVEMVKTLSFYDELVDPLAVLDRKEGPVPAPVKLPPPPPIQLAPHKIKNLYPASRLHVYGIVSPAWLIGDKVTLRGELATGEQIALEVPIVTARLATASCPAPTAKASTVPPLLHAIAARKLIQDLEDGSNVLTPPGTEGDLAARTLKAAIVRLGRRYSLASAHTSFVAVDEADLATGRVRKAVTHALDEKDAGFYSFYGAAPGGSGSGAFCPTRVMPLGGYAGAGPSYGSVMQLQAPGAVCFAAIAVPPPAPMCAPSMAPVHGAVRAKAAPAPGRASSTPLRGLSRAFKNVFSTGAPAQAAPPAAEKPTAIPAPEPEPAASHTAQDQLERLARAQSFAGSFAPAALAALGPHAPPIADLVARLPARYAGARADEVAATLAVLHFLARELAGEREAWEALADKARVWVARELGVAEGDIDALAEGFK